MRAVAAGLVVGAVLAAVASAEVKMPAIFSDNMVLQRDQQIPVWGKAAPGERVTVTVGKRSGTATAGADGKWSVSLKPLTTGGPLAMSIAGSNTITFTNVVAGEVWICSGQSNMELPLGAASNSQAEVASATYPGIRLFTVGKAPAGMPQEDCKGAWTVCSPASAGSFSAVGYFFARNVHQGLQVPVGMINSSWGGTCAETWTPFDALKQMFAFSNRVVAYEQAIKDYAADKATYDKKREEAMRVFQENRALWLDKIFVDEDGAKARWFDPATPLVEWKEAAFPMPWANNVLHDYSGFVWGRKDVEIPESWVGKDLALNLGPMDDIDETYVNGAVVGKTLDTTLWQTPRQYKVPAALVTSRKVSVVVQIMNTVGAIGMYGSEGQLALSLGGAASTEKPVPLAGTWKYAFGGKLDPRAVPQPANLPSVPGLNANEPATLYNGMIAPLVPYGLRGAIWYQGESNAGAPDEYAELFPTMIGSWRRAWGQEFPFYYTQLANFMGRQQQSIEVSGWADLRDAQTATLRTRNTGMAVIIDIGEGPDIHPKNKQDVGRRLALWALAKTYGTKIEYSGPLYKSLTVKAGEASVSFEHAGSGLVARGEPLVGFAVAGTNKVFHAAQARIEGERVVVWSDKVPAPAAVRYAWANNPICNLYNREGLPASPFRTDAWVRSEISVAAEALSEPSAPAGR